MNVKLADIFMSKDALQKLLQSDLPVKTAFRISRIAKKINDVFNDIEEQRIKLVNKLGEVQEGSDEIKVPPDKLKEFHAELSSLLEEEIELDIEKIKLSELGDIKLRPVEIASLEYLIEE